MTQEILYVCEEIHPTITKKFLQSPVHVHDHPELSIILNGEAVYSIKDKTHIVRKGELVLFNPNVPHSVYLSPQTQYKDLHIGYSTLTESVMEHFDKTGNDFIILKLSSEKKYFYTLCEELLQEYRLRKKDCRTMIHAIASQLLVLIYRELVKEGAAPSEHLCNMGYPDKRKVVDFITHYINENYMNEISLDMFAKDMYLSQVYISKIFKEETGSSPINYLIKTRLSKAKELLEEQDLPIKVVSGQVGYEDAYHFSKLFKKYYGYAPSALKRRKN